AARARACPSPGWWRARRAWRRARTQRRSSEPQAFLLFGLCDLSSPTCFAVTTRQTRPTRRPDPPGLLDLPDPPDLRDPPGLDVGVASLLRQCTFQRSAQ